MTQAIAPRHTALAHKRDNSVAELLATLLCVLALFGHSSSVEARTYACVFNVGSGDVSIIDSEAQEVADTVDVGHRVF